MLCQRTHDLLECPGASARVMVGKCQLLHDGGLPIASGCFWPIAALSRSAAISHKRKLRYICFWSVYTLITEFIAARQVFILAGPVLARDSLFFRKKTSYRTAIPPSRLGASWGFRLIDQLLIFHHNYMKSENLFLLYLFQKGRLNHMLDFRTATP